ncbi:50S ribosomal protein L6 [Telmatospirillum sp. J64-1]|uniref:50S ribosomal protein L6 n=1 Tax=Telmatospirillum sp. J64-1 TaxID=2502183 RepID=UPI00115EC601|nr:50S ribosomal protein L6 [Telmatospirillum sp. J64-1]
MSRVGKYPVVVPSGVTVNLNGQDLSVKGKLGEKALRVADDIGVRVEGDKLWVEPRNETKRARMMWGTTRAIVANMVKGVSEGFTINLDINGVGYRAAAQGQVLNLQLGYSHDINYQVPQGVTIKTEKPTSISVTGSDKQVVGQVAAEIRAFRGPEPYKGKGVKYSTETILRKEGKKK